MLDSKTTASVYNVRTGFWMKVSYEQRAWTEQNLIAMVEGIAVEWNLEYLGPSYIPHCLEQRTQQLD